MQKYKIYCIQFRFNPLVNTQRRKVVSEKCNTSDKIQKIEFCSQTCKKKESITCELTDEMINSAFYRKKTKLTLSFIKFQCLQSKELFCSSVYSVSIEQWYGVLESNRSENSLPALNGTADIGTYRMQLTITTEQTRICPSCFLRSVDLSIK